MRISNQIDYIANWEAENRNLSTPNLKERITRAVLYFFIKPFLYPGASIVRYVALDLTRQKKGVEKLKKIGGKEIHLQTPDHEQICGMIMEAKVFKENMSEYFELKSEGETWFWTLKQDFYIQKDEWMKPSEEGLKKIKELAENWHIPLKVEEKNGFKEPRFYIGSEPLSQKTGVILSHGNGMDSTCYKTFAFFYLMRGIDVLLVDHRGYRKSSGAPSDKKCKLDLDTAYQYMRDQQGISNENLIVHGHCLGSTIATDLAARRNGIHLILDRPIADTKERMIDFFPRAKPLIERVTPKYINLNNLETLPQVTGNILCLHSTMDKVVPFSEIRQLIEVMPNNQGQVRSLLPINQVGHVKVWTEDSTTTLGIDLFLNKIKQKESKWNR